MSLSEEPDPGTPSDQASKSTEPVWTYRGYQLRGSEFTTAMAHMFRAEVQRANVWRQRLDTTTNWAVLTTAAVLTFIFGSSETSHPIILIDLLLVTIFLVIEARRYRYYELWSYRVRLMETDFFAPMLVPPFHPSPEWAEALAENLLHPTFPISMWEAIGRRLRRNYLAIYMILMLAWLVHIWWKPVSANSLAQFVENAGFQGISGEWVLGIGLVFFGTFVLIALLTVPLQQAAGEVLPRFPGVEASVDLGDLDHPKEGKDQQLHAWFRPVRRRQQLMTWIITDRSQEVSERILKDLRRGVTALPGTGVFTGQPHTVLMCALTITEVPQLRNLVHEVDPAAFVIVSPAQEVFGSGFMPLQKKS
jgi:uncharacterized membrane protein